MANIEIFELDYELDVEETGSVLGGGNTFAFNQNTQVAGDDVEDNDVDQDADADD